jgi:short-subunit dehydrogenase
MEMQDGECHIVNTASTAGITYGGGSAPYAVTKHGVVALSEAAYGDHQERQSNVGISVLCPHFTATRIMESNRNRPASLSDRTPSPSSPEFEEFMEEFNQNVDNGLPPADLAAMVFQGIRKKRFYILTSDAVNDVVLERAKYITEGVIRM